MKKPYKFTHRNGRNIEVCFSSQPNRWISTGTTDKKRALEFALNYKGESKGKRITLGEVIEEMQREDFKELRQFYTNHSKEKREVFYSNLASLIKNFISPLFRFYTLESLTAREIEENLAKLDKNNLYKNRILQALKIIYLSANIKGYIDKKNDWIESYKYVYKEKGIFTSEELENIFKLENFTSQKWFLYFLFLRDLGWRPSEVASLKYTDIKNNGGVYTTSAVVYNGKKASLQNKIKTSSKGQNYKIGVLSKETLSLFNTLNEKTEDLIFIFNGKLLLTQTANRELVKACKRANVDLKNRTQYSFRHTFNTSNYYKLEDKTRLELMGHTKDRAEYLHITAEERLKNLLSDKRTLEILGA